MSDARPSQRRIFRMLASQLIYRQKFSPESNARCYNPCDRNLNTDPKFATGRHWGRLGWDGSCWASTSELRCIGTRLGYKRDGVRYTGVTSATLEASSSCPPPYASFRHVTEFKNQPTSSHTPTTSRTARAGATTSFTHDILSDFRTRPDKGVDLHLTLRHERPVRDCINGIPVDTATETNTVYPI